MNNHFNDMTSSESWQLLVNTAIRALTEAGYVPQRQPGRGRANVWTIEEGGRQQRVSVRTTRDRWFAFPPLDNGTKWKTLDDVDIVVVAAVDDSNEPNGIEVYRFDANEVRKRFDAAYSARIRAGQSEPDNFGMWVSLDVDSRGLPSSVGSGLASEYTAIAVYSLDQLIPRQQGCSTGRRRRRRRPGTQPWHDRRSHEAGTGAHRGPFGRERRGREVELLY